MPKIDGLEFPPSDSTEIDGLEFPPESKKSTFISDVLTGPRELAAGLTEPGAFSVGGKTISVPDDPIAKLMRGIITFPVDVANRFVENYLSPGGTAQGAFAGAFLPAGKEFAKEPSVKQGSRAATELLQYAAPAALGKIASKTKISPLTELDPFARIRIGEMSKSPLPPPPEIAAAEGAKIVSEIEGRIKAKAGGQFPEIPDNAAKELGIRFDQYTAGEKVKTKNGVVKKLGEGYHFSDPVTGGGSFGPIKDLTTLPEVLREHREGFWAAPNEKFTPETIRNLGQKLGKTGEEIDAKIKTFLETRKIARHFPEPTIEKPTDKIFEAPPDKLLFGELPAGSIRASQVSDLMSQALDVPVNAEQIGQFHEINMNQANSLGDYMGRTYRKIIPKPYKNPTLREQLFKDYQAAQGVYDPALESKYGKRGLLPIEYHNELINGLGKKARELGILDNITANYFTQRWTGPKDLISKISDFVPDIINRNFQRNKGRIFDDIQAGLDYFKEQSEKMGDKRWLEIKPVTDLEALDRLYLREFARSASLRAMADQMVNTKLSAESPLTLAVRETDVAKIPDGYVKMPARSFGPDFYVNKTLEPKLMDMISVGDQGRVSRAFYGTSYFLKRLALLTDFIVHPINVASRSFGPLLQGLASRGIGGRISAFGAGLRNDINLQSRFIRAGGEPIGNMRRSLDLQKLADPIFREELTGWKKQFKQTTHFLDNALSFTGNTMFKGIEHFQQGLFALKEAENLANGMSKAEAATEAALVANNVTGAMPNHVMSNASRAGWRAILMSPTWTRSQLDTWGQAFKKSPLLRGLPENVKAKAASDARLSLATGLASSMIGLELLNYYLNGRFTWEKEHGGTDYLFSLQTGKNKNGDATYLHWPVGFFITQLLGYGIHDIPQIYEGIKNPAQAKGLAEYRVFGKVNPLVRDTYMLLKGDYRRIANSLAPIGISGEINFPAESDFKHFALAIAGAGRYAGRRGGYAGDISRKQLAEQQQASSEVLKSVNKYLASGDAKGLGEYLNKMDEPNSGLNISKNLAKLRDMERMGSVVDVAQSPITTVWKMMGKEQARLRFFKLSPHDRHLVWTKLIEEGTDPMILFFGENE